MSKNSKSSESGYQSMFCIVMVIVIGILLWMMFFRESECKQKVVVPLPNGQVAVMTTEKWAELSRPYSSPKYQNKEGFYVSRSDYIPSTQTENEYTPMLTLYNPKDTSRAPSIPGVDNVRDPSKLPVVPPVSNTPKQISEPYGNQWIPEGLMIDNSNPRMKLISQYDQDRINLAKASPFYMNNSGELMNGEIIQ